MACRHRCVPIETDSTGNRVMGLTRIGAIALFVLLAGVVLLIAGGALAAAFGVDDFALGQRFVAVVFLLAVVAFVPTVAALVLLERLAQHLGLLDGDVLDAVAQRWRRARQPIDPDWERLPTMPEARYRAYLESDAWKRKRRYVLYYAGHRCRVCNGGRRLEVHHRTYKRLGCERPDDLTVLCQDCHRLFHESRRP